MLTYLLHPPVMLLAANKLSTGIGVRPRGDRLEVTADFTPDPDLVIATASLVTGIILAVLEWPEHTLAEMRRRGLPIIAGFRPCKHSSRKGFVARHFCFPRNPFAADINSPDWRLTDGRHLSLRQIALEIAWPFRDAIQAVTDSDAFTHVFEVPLLGSARSAPCSISPRARRVTRTPVTASNGIGERIAHSRVRATSRSSTGC